MAGRRFFNGFFDPSARAWQTVERYQEAIEVFEFNIELFPDVANVYDSLGEAHMFTKNKEKAIHYYEKALEIDTELESAIRALEKLKAKE